MNGSTKLPFTTRNVEFPSQETSGKTYGNLQLILTHSFPAGKPTWQSWSGLRTLKI